MLQMENMVDGVLQEAVRKAGSGDMQAKLFMNRIQKHVCMPFK